MSGLSTASRIMEEYNFWKKESPKHYDLVITHALKWPSLTVQWLPDRTEVPEESCAVQNVILGTHTSENEPNYLMLAQVKLPSEDPEIVMPAVRADGTPNRKVQIIQQINHDGEVNRARYMPQNQFIIATKTASAEVYVFDYSKHPSKPPLNGACDPDLRLRGHNCEGFGLSWSPFKQGHLLSGSDDGQICLWDINAVSKNKSLNAMQTFKVLEGVVEDVAWHQTHENLFGSVADDHYLHIWDLRASVVNKPIQTVAAHQSQVTCLAFHPFNERFLVTGSADSDVKIFDLRKLSDAICTLDHHKEEICQVGWSPQHETILGSCCHGRRLLVWDLDRVGAKQTPEEAEEGPPGLLFVHGGHTSKISDFSWNQCEDMVVASVAEDNILQVWQIADHIYLEEAIEPGVDASNGSEAQVS